MSSKKTGFSFLEQHQADCRGFEWPGLRTQRMVEDPEVSVNARQEKSSGIGTIIVATVEIALNSAWKISLHEPFYVIK